MSLYHLEQLFTMLTLENYWETLSRLDNNWWFVKAGAGGVEMPVLLHRATRRRERLRRVNRLRNARSDWNCACWLMWELWVYQMQVSPAC